MRVERQDIKFVFMGAEHTLSAPVLKLNTNPAAPAAPAVPAAPAAPAAPEYMELTRLQQACEVRPKKTPEDNQAAQPAKEDELPPELPESWRKIARRILK